MKKMLFITVFAFAMLFNGCSSDATMASKNLSKAAEQFEIERRVVFYNGITDKYILEIRGRCSVHSQNGKLDVTCKTGPDAYKKHYLGLSDNVTYFAEQLESKDVSVYHYRVIFKPSEIINDIDYRGSIGKSINTLKPDNKDD